MSVVWQADEREVRLAEHKGEEEARPSLPRNASVTVVRIS
jgi:hypothetical protein